MNDATNIVFGKKAVQNMHFGDLHIPADLKQPRIEYVDGVARPCHFESLENGDWALAYLEYGGHQLAIPPIRFERMTTAQDFLYYNPKSTSFAGLEFPVLKNADAMYAECKKCRDVCLEYPVLETAKDMFRNAGLEAAQIDAILGHLPAYTSGSHIITFTGCPGASGCTPSIGTTKGWTVQV